MSVRCLCVPYLYVRFYVCAVSSFIVLVFPGVQDKKELVLEIVVCF